MFILVLELGIAPYRKAVFYMLAQERGSCEIKHVRWAEKGLYFACPWATHNQQPTKHSQDVCLTILGSYSINLLFFMLGFYPAD